MRRIANGEPWTLPPTIDDPATLEEIRAALAALGYPRDQR
jgi:propionyl-CoA synthetase